MLPLDAESGAVEAQAPSTQDVPEHLSDIVLANAIVDAIRAVPGVVDIGQGLFSKAATYGPGKHINGVVLRHSASGELAVEVYVVLEEASFIKAFSDVSHSDASSSSGTTPVLLRFTGEVRAAVNQTLAHLGLPVPTMVDVTIDDIR